MGAKKIRFSMMLPSFVDPGEREPYRRTFDFARRIDKLGFHMGTFAHHSFTPDIGDPAAPFLLLSAVAARTERLRLGTGIYLAALHHPVTVAEQAATLDQISGGRAVLGVAVGYQDYEYEGFGVDFAERGRRLEESLKILRGAWSAGRYNYDGEFFSIPDLPVNPACVQSPHLPILVGGSSPTAIKRAGRLGDGWFTLPQEALPQMRAQVEIYRKSCREAGREPYICLMRNAWIASDVATVEDEWLGPMVEFSKTFAAARTGTIHDDTVLERVVAGDDVPLEDFAHGRAIAGTPEMCITELKRWQEAIDFDEISLIFGGSQEQGRLERAVDQFAAEVMPAFA